MKCTKVDFCKLIKEWYPELSLKYVKQHLADVHWNNDDTNNARDLAKALILVKEDIEALEDKLKDNFNELMNYLVELRLPIKSIERGSKENNLVKITFYDDESLIVCTIQLPYQVSYVEDGILVDLLGKKN